jgi:hypothetical protein
LKVFTRGYDQHGWVTENIQADNKTVRKGTTNKKRNKKTNSYNIVTWNVRSMYEGKLDIVREEMKRLDIDILGISEMKWDR